MSLRLPITPTPLRVAVLVDTSTSWGRRIIEGVHRYQEQAGGWQLFVEPRGVDQRRWLPKEWRGDGVIARVGFPELSEQLKDLGIPVVNVSGIRLPDSSFPRITTNLRESGEMAAEHFFSRGFKNFAYFSLLKPHYVAEHRDGFSRRIEQMGYVCHESDDDFESGNFDSEWSIDIERLAQWLKGLPKPIAILCWNTGGARELLYGAAHGGWMVPEDIAVMSGSEDDLFCKVAPIPISAVNNAAEEIGFLAADQLNRLITGPPEETYPDVLLSPVGVVVRQSTETFAIEDPATVRALRYVRENPTMNCTVDDLAAYAGICRRTLEQRFAKHIGRSPASEIRRVKVEFAVNLLRTTSLSVNAVAERAGFSSSEYMATVFRNQLGMSPLSIRKPDA